MTTETSFISSLGALATKTVTIGSLSVPMWAVVAAAVTAVALAIIVGCAIRRCCQRQNQQEQNDQWVFVNKKTKQPAAPQPLPAASAQNNPAPSVQPAEKWVEPRPILCAETLQWLKDAKKALPPTSTINEPAVVEPTAPSLTPQQQKEKNLTLALLNACVIH